MSNAPDLHNTRMLLPNKGLRVKPKSESIHMRLQHVINFILSQMSYLAL